MDSRTPSRKRSRSPYRASDHVNDASHARKRHRSRSPHHRKHVRAPVTQARLPFNRTPLSKHDLRAYEPLFAEYLIVQKRIEINELEDDELKGRWKSFFGKWNRGELSEGWYDPELAQRVGERYVSSERQETVSNARIKASEQNAQEEDEDDGYGPAPLPAANRRAGPAIPRLTDLQLRAEDLASDRASKLADARAMRKADRKQAVERLDELAPRADAGTRERQLEKKAVAAASNRAFREAKSPGAEEVGERDLMGEDGIEGYKKQVKARERAKNEREIRKEEAFRARAKEREERMGEAREKEEKTMAMLRELAKERFG